MNETYELQLFSNDAEVTLLVVGYILNPNG